jgi:hypothetical protein
MLRRDRHKNQGGQGTLEFIVIVPMMFLLVSLVLYAGWWTYAKLSAQNAAYSYGIFATRSQPLWDVLYGAHYEAERKTIDSPIGMKQLWQEDIARLYQFKKERFGRTRTGGTGMIVAVSPRGMSVEEIREAFIALGISDSGSLPRATAFFYYAPLISANLNR